MKLGTKALIVSALAILACSNPFDTVQDLKDKEEYEPPIIVDFENFNYQAMERAVFLHKFHGTLMAMIRFYQDNLKKIIGNPTAGNQLAGVELTKLFGPDFATFLGDVREMEIHLKAYTEREIDHFFLAECSDKFFREKGVYAVCTELQQQIRFHLMFENFFDWGWENDVYEICETVGTDPQFEEVLFRKLRELRLHFKLAMNLVRFSTSKLQKDFVSKISKRFGKGLRFQIVTTKPDNAEEGEEGQELGEELESDVVNETPEEFRSTLKQTMQELMSSEFNINNQGEVDLRPFNTTF
jgi:hypothetical protein